MRLFHFAFLALLGALAATPGSAQTFRAYLGDRELGTLAYGGVKGPDGPGNMLRTTLDNTPLGVGDGIFEATSWPARTEAGKRVRQYASTGKSSRKSRSISITLDRGQVLAVAVTPEGERTGLSVASKVPSGVLDPVAAFGLMLGAGDCPSAFRIYDGRRVVQVAPRGAERAGSRKTCQMSYDVVAGPGHLSPFRFASLRLDLVYDGGTLAEIDVGTGPFTLRLVR